MTNEHFCRLVGAAKQALCVVIDTETDGEAEASGKLASHLVAAIMTEFMALPRSPFADDLNATLAAASLPWRMVRVN